MQPNAGGWLPCFGNMGIEGNESDSESLILASSKWVHQRPFRRGTEASSALPSALAMASVRFPFPKRREDWIKAEDVNAARLRLTILDVGSVTRGSESQHRNVTVVGAKPGM